MDKGTIVLVSILSVTIFAFSHFIIYPKIQAKLNNSHGRNITLHQTCELLRRNAERTGYSISYCRGRLGNQLGVLSLGLEIYLKYGIKVFVSQTQAKFLHNAFEISSICSGKDAFCTIVPSGE